MYGRHIENGHLYFRPKSISANYSLPAHIGAPKATYRAFLIVFMIDRSLKQPSRDTMCIKCWRVCTARKIVIFRPSEGSSVWFYFFTKSVSNVQNDEYGRC